MIKKKICIITATRSEYGLLRWLIEEVKNDGQLLLQLVVTGSHLSPEFGLTYKEIEKDGYSIDEKVEMILSSNTTSGIVKAMGVCSLGFADVFNRLKPDVVVVLGDRYELLPICSAALVMNIPVAHISGGDVTEGAIDNQIRNAITMMASIHFPGVEASAERIKRMIGSSENIFTVGEPGLDNFMRLKLWSREKLAQELSLKVDKDWILLTYHPETKLDLKTNLSAVKNIINVLNTLPNVQVIITGANADYGGSQINKVLKKEASINKEKYHYITSLGQVRYLSLMKEVKFIIGNSSSGVIEAPFLKKPVINIGNRQKGRYMCGNIISSSYDIKSLNRSIDLALNSTNEISDSNYYGKGNTSELIFNELKNYILKKNV